MLEQTALQPEPGRRKNDPEGTRRNIVDVATEEFASHGYSGARVDAIAAKTRTSKRMIYYYFGGKEQLYLAVLEQAYRSIRELEESLDTQNCGPVEAIRRLVGATFDHDERNPNFIRLVSIENIHRAEHVAQSERLTTLNNPAIELIARILDRGRASGAFVRDVDAVDLHMMISAFCVFRVANRHTFGAIFDRDLTSPALRTHYREMLADMVVGYVTSG